MTARAFALATLALSLPRAALAFEPCATPIPGPIPRGVQLFSPANGAAGLPTNAAIVFAPIGGAALDVVVSDSAGASVGTGALETLGLLQILHPSGALAPGAQYRVEFTDTAIMPPQVLSTSSFSTGAGGDLTPPALAGAPVVAIGPYCAIRNSYPIDVTWPAATDADESVLVYSVTLVNTSSLTGIAATTALTASFFAARGTEFDVAVRAVDRTGAASPAISKPVFIAGASDPAPSGCRCAVAGPPGRPVEILSSLIFGMLAVIGVRRAIRVVR